LRDALPEIERRGAVLRVVGTGDPRHAGWFAERHGLPGRVYVDPGRVAYRALGLHSGILRSIGPRSASHAWRAFRAGHRQGKTRGDPWQQAGTIVVSTDGDLLYLHRSSVAGDHAPLADVLAAIPAHGT
jgi:peroxiredoxin